MNSGEHIQKNEMIADEAASPTDHDEQRPMLFPSIQRSVLYILFRNLLRSPKSVIGLAIVLFFVLVALFAPTIAPGDPQAFVARPNQPPSSEHYFGTTGQGKDVFTQTVWGARLSLLVGFGASTLLTLFNTAIGVIAGYFRGWVDNILTFIMNLFLIIPGLPLLIVLSGYLKAGIFTLIIVIAITGWAFGARVKRSFVLSLREKDFVAAAKVSGQSDFGIIYYQILPNMINMIFGGFVGGVTGGIIAITGLSFLGLTNLSEVNWGTNLYWAQVSGALIQGTWWTILPSGLSVALISFGLSLVNYGMDEVTNPRLKADKELKRVVKDYGVQRVRATPVVPRQH
jgi:peptide/nickel transport system permease protein